MALFDRYRQWRRLRQDQRADEAELGRQVDAILEVVDPRLRMLRGVRRRVGPALRHAHLVIDERMEQLPPTLEIARERWSQDPFLRACFTNPGAMQRLFDGHRALSAYLAGDGALNAPVVYAGLGMSLKESQRFGHALQGDMVQRDVAQEVITLGDHRISAFATSADGFRARLRERVLEDLAMRATQAAFGARVRRDELVEERTKLQVRMRLYEQQARGLDTFWHEEEVIDRHAGELRSRLAEMEQELGELEQSAADLDDYLDMTVEVFSSVDRDLELETRTFHLDASNICHDGPGEGITAVPMTVVHVAKRPPRIFQPVTFASGLARGRARGGLDAAGRALGVH